MTSVVLLCCWRKSVKSCAQCGVVCRSVLHYSCEILKEDSEIPGGHNGEAKLLASQRCLTKTGPADDCFLRQPPKGTTSDWEKSSDQCKNGEESLDSITSDISPYMKTITAIGGGSGRDTSSLYHHPPSPIFVASLRQLTHSHRGSMAMFVDRASGCWVVVLRGAVVVARVCSSFSVVVAVHRPLLTN